jgi:hypothetical protein
MDNFESRINPIFNTLSLLYLLSSQTGLIIMTKDSSLMIAQCVLVYIEAFFVYLIIVEHSNSCNLITSENNFLYSLSLLRIRDNLQKNKRIYDRYCCFILTFMLVISLYMAAIQSPNIKNWNEDDALVRYFAISTVVSQWLIFTNRMLYLCNKFCLFSISMCICCPCSFVAFLVLRRCRRNQVISEGDEVNSQSAIRRN